MLSMPFAASSFSSGSSRSRVIGVLAALITALAPAAARADLGDPSTQGYTGDVPESPQDDADGEYADTDPSALTDFRDTLDPHGAWTQDPTYGTIWVPNAAEVGPDFAPYQTSGHWGVADTGDWMWESDYDWGYVPFHYGRWVWAGSYWGWIPGREYAPAWVTWRVGDGGYIGWAPLAPTWYWADGVAVGLWTVPYVAYCFVPTTHVFYNNVSTYVVRDRGAVASAASSTRPYHAATPAAGRGGSPRHRPSSPSFSAAHVPHSAVPQRRATADARARAFSTHSGTAAVRRSALGSTARPQLGNAGARGNAWNRSYDGFGRSATPGSRAEGVGQPGSRAFGPSYAGTPGRATPSFHGAPGAHAAHAAPSRAPSFQSAPAQGARVAPAFRGSPGAVHPAPSFHSSAPTFHSTPSVRPSAPAVHAPSHSVSVPRPSASRPAAPRFGGGGGRRR
ncbi:hypothetical protein A7982_12131 [Minicystis rosea]|nr:hypothetical protein A7982_12131 [Minicystis rosea]